MKKQKVLKSYFAVFNRFFNSFQQLIRMIFSRLMSYQQRLINANYLFLFINLKSKNKLNKSEVFKKDFRAEENENNSAGNLRWL